MIYAKMRKYPLKNCGNVYKIKVIHIFCAVMVKLHIEKDNRDERSWVYAGRFYKTCGSITAA